MRVHQTLRYLGGGSAFMKNQYIGGIDKKGGAWTVCKFKRGLGKNQGGGCFWGGGLVPQSTLCVSWGDGRF